MGVLDIIKERLNKIFSKNQIMQLSDLNESNVKNNGEGISNKFNDSLKCQIPKSPNISLEEAIDLWVDNYVKFLSKTTDNEGVAYASLISINATAGIPKGNGKNHKNEEKFFENINKRNHKTKNHNNDICVIPQGNNTFYNIFTENSLLSEASTSRLYINCDNSNIAKISDEIVKRMNYQENFHFKFLGDTEEFPRSEKIVIYTHGKEDENDIISKIADIKEKNPHLFNNTKEFPFMKNYLGFIGVGETPQIENFIHSNGEVTKESMSYNKFLATVLEDSLNDTVNNVANSNRSLHDYLSKNKIITAEYVIL